VHPTQLAYVIFRKYINSTLSADDDVRVEIRWIPGHERLAGHERADRIAKNAINDPPITHTTITWAREKANRRPLQAWRKEWAALPRTNQTAVALRDIPPSLRLNPSLHHANAPRDAQTRIVHTITGHGHTGAYDARFVPEEDPSCLRRSAANPRTHPSGLRTSQCLPPLPAQSLPKSLACNPP
jgi:hypothetical protein